MLTNMWAVLKDLAYERYIPEIRAWDIVEIAIIIFGVYYIFKHIKNTRAWLFVKGIFFMFAIYTISYLCSFNAITVIFERVSYFAIIAIIFILQPELRKLFESIGVKKVNPFKNVFKKEKKFVERFSVKTAEEITRACEHMGDMKTGALIVIEKDIPLQSYINSGILVDAIITKELLINTFEHNTPLHDGAVIIQHNRLIAATCYLPLSENLGINKSYGTRHRAALGMSEATDAFIIVVSEETGHISACYSGNMYENLAPEELLSMLKDFRKTGKEIKPGNIISKFTRNLVIKAASVIVGILTWFLLINIYNPLMSVQFNDIPITLQGESLAKNTGQSFSIKGDTTVNVIVRDKREVIEKIRAEDIIVYADLGNLSAINTIPLKGSIPSAPDAEFDFGYNSSINIEFEDIISKDFEVQIETTGSAMSGYYVYELKPNTQTVSVMGPRSLINIVDKVVIPVDINGVSTAFNSNSAPVVYDVNGEVMTNVEVGTKNVYVSGFVYKTKIVDLELKINTTDKLAYSVNDFSYAPETIRIAAKDEVIDSIVSVGGEITIDIDEKAIVDGKYVTDVSLKDYVTGDFVLVNKDTEATISLDISRYVKKTMSVSADEISLVNIPPNKKISANFSQLQFSIWVPEEWADTITTQDLDPKVDFVEAENGTNNYEITFISDLIKFDEAVIGSFSISDE